MVARVVVLSVAAVAMAAAGMVDAAFAQGRHHGGGGTAAIGGGGGVRAGASASFNGSRGTSLRSAATVGAAPSTFGGNRLSGTRFSSFNGNRVSNFGGRRFNTFGRSRFVAVNSFGPTRFGRTWGGWRSGWRSRRFARVGFGLGVGAAFAAAYPYYDDYDWTYASNYCDPGYRWGAGWDWGWRRRYCGPYAFAGGPVVSVGFGRTWW